MNNKQTVIHIFLIGRSRGIHAPNAWTHILGLTLQIMCNVCHHPLDL